MSSHFKSCINNSSVKLCLRLKAIWETTLAITSALRNVTFWALCARPIFIHSPVDDICRKRRKKERKKERKKKGCSKKLVYGHT